MSKGNDEKEYEIDEDDDDEEFFKEYAKKKTAEILQSKPIKIVKGKKHDINHVVFDKLVQTFQKGPEGQCIIDYINYGPSINEELRGGKNENYKKTVTCLDKYSVPLSKILNTSDDYIVLYRTMYKKYDVSSSQGFISTSNRLLPGFGSYFMKIYVPINTRVLIADITKSVKEVGKEEMIKTYEIILPRGLQLEYVGKKFNNDLYTDIHYYIASTTDDTLMRRTFTAINEDLIA